MLEPVWTVGPILSPSLVEVLAQKAESEAQEGLSKETDDANNISVDEEDGDYEWDHEEEEIEEIDVDDLFNDDDGDDF